MKAEATDASGKLLYIKALNLKRPFAIHLLDSGIDLKYIKEFWGHKSSMTTEIYTYVSKANLARIEPSLDSILKDGEI